MNAHDALYEAASNAVAALAADTSVSAEQSAASLKSLHGEIGSIMDGAEREADVTPGCGA